jgi:hypothetical protein
VDTGHLVTFTEGMGFNVRKVAGWKSTIFGGEGLVVDLTGRSSPRRTRAADTPVENRASVRAESRP